MLQIATRAFRIRARTMEFVVEDLTTTTASVPLALLDRPATEVPI